MLTYTHVSNKNIGKIKILGTGCLRKRMEGAQKDERMENRGDRSFIQRMYMRSSSATPKSSLTAGLQIRSER